MVEKTWRLEWRSPDATGRKIFRQHTYTHKNLMIADVADMLARDDVTQLHVVELPTEQCQKCGGIFPNCECSYT